MQWTQLTRLTLTLVALSTSSWLSAPASSQTLVPSPALIELFSPATDVYTPELDIVSPQEGETLSSSTVFLELDLKRFPIGLDPITNMGLHIKLIVNNLEPVPIYDISEPIELELPPGTHTVRAVAVRPWSHSYRNLPAFAHVTFNVLEATDANDPEFKVGSPLITLISPASGTYGAEPILLDYLIDGVNLGGAMVRYTLNGVSETTTDRSPLYLTGWQPGDNTLVVELVGRDGFMLPNQGTTYNRVERLINYQPGGDDTLSRLIRGELEVEDYAEALGPDPFIYDEQGKVQRLN